MDYEKKYKDALERAKGIYKDTWNSYILKIFPELVESEDERVRKELIDYINRLTASPNYIDKYNAWISWLEKQGEQKPANKVEPKFKVGDWITDGYVGGQITSIEDNYPCYKIADFMGGINTSIPFSLQDNYHLWTIQDAKDGDVLAYVTDEEDLWIMIYRSLYEPYEGHVHYHALLVNDNFSDKGTCCICIDNLKPATKEQRDLLFKKMREAGYEWDVEKKEVKEIGQKSAWSEEDEWKFSDILALLTGGVNCHYNTSDLLTWFKVLKDRVQSQNTWKPSEEQIRAIRLASAFVVDDFGEYPTLSEILMDLEEQLRKIKENKL